MKLILQGTQGMQQSSRITRSGSINVIEIESTPEQVSQLVQSIIQEDFLFSLAKSIYLLPFESRKDTQSIFSYVLRHKTPNNPNGDPPALKHTIQSRPEVFLALCRGYQHKESAMPCGVVLREALKHESVAALIMYDQSQEGERAARLDEIDFEASQFDRGVFWQFFGWIDRGAFEVSTDAFTTFRVKGALLNQSSWKADEGPGATYEAQTARRPILEHQFRYVF